MSATTTHTGFCIGTVKKCVLSLEHLTSTIAHLDFTSTIIRRRDNHV